MDDPSYSDEHQPVTWMGGHPIYAAHFVALVFAGSMVINAVLKFFTLDGVFDGLTFLSPAVLHGEVWRVFTYGFVNSASLWFVVELLMLVWFGREVERFFGRRKFFTLYVGLYLVPPLVYTLFGLARPTVLAGESAGFGLFIAFATLYPNAVMLFNLLAKWVAWVLVGLYALEMLSVHDGFGLASLAATVGAAYGYVRFQQGRLTLPTVAFPRRAPPPPPPINATAEVDALLDKIARSGLASLSAKERAKLDAARQDLQKRKRS
jgi:membrane associated rhomboid family serine protease